MHIMESMLDKEQLKKVLAQLKKAVKKARQDGKKVFNVVFLCRKGRHRSICVSRFARWCLERDGYEIPIIENTSSYLDETWDELCTSCKLCRSRMSERKEVVRRRVLNLWDAKI